MMQHFILFSGNQVIFLNESDITAAHTYTREGFCCSLVTTAIVTKQVWESCSDLGTVLQVECVKIPLATVQDFQKQINAVLATKGGSY